MFLKAIQLDNSSYIELSDRITVDGSKLQITMRGPKDDRSVTVMSAILEQGDAVLLAQILSEWLSSAHKDPIK
jgi:hypothetical protein